MSNENIASLRNYFNNLINQQIEQNRFDQSRNKKFSDGPEQSGTKQQTTEADFSVLDNLSNLLGAAQSDGTDSKFILSIYKLVQSGANIENVVNLLASLANDTGDLLYTRTGGDDPNLTAQNRIKYLAGDLEDFINQATKIAQCGKDINKYIDSITNVFNHGDYDDIRKVISATDSILDGNHDLNKFLNFVDNATNNQINEMEVNLFSIQTMTDYGASLDTALKVMNNMVIKDMEGRKNMSELNAVTHEAMKAGCSLPKLFEDMAESGNSKNFMDKWLADRGMKIISLLDNKKYDRIEGIDNKKDMVIHQGEKAALCAQAMSSTDGILPASVLFWSSVQTGSMAKGSNYLDLSKLKAGVYDIFVKVGGYAGGTDTAKRRVVVLAKEGNENNGLGDTNDDDNTEKGIDFSNPGHEDDFPEEEGLDNRPFSEKDYKKRRDELFRKICMDVMGKDNNSVDLDSSQLEQFVDMLNKLNAQNEKSGSWQEKLAELEKNQELYRETVSQVRKQIAKETEDKKLRNKKIIKEDEDNAKEFQDFLFKQELLKENNGLGDTKDQDNPVKGTDESNPGKKSDEKTPVPVTEHKANQPVINTENTNDKPKETKNNSSKVVEHIKII